MGMDVTREKRQRGPRQGRQTVRLHRGNKKGSTSARRSSDDETPSATVAPSPSRTLSRTYARLSAFDRLGDISSYIMSDPESFAKKIASEPARQIPLLHTRSEVDTVHQLLLLHRSDPTPPVQVIRPSGSSVSTNGYAAAPAPPWPPVMIPGSVRACEHLSPIVHTTPDSVQKPASQPENRVATIQMDGTTTHRASFPQRKRGNKLTLEEKGERRRLLPLQHDQSSSGTEVVVPCKPILITMTPATETRPKERREKKIRELRPSTDIVLDKSGDWLRCPAATLFRQVLQQYTHCTMGAVVNHFYAVGGRLLRVEQNYYLPVSHRHARLAVSILRQDILAKEMAATESKTSLVINDTLNNESTVKIECPFAQAPDSKRQEAIKRKLWATDGVAGLFSDHPNPPKVILQSDLQGKIKSQDTKFCSRGGTLVDLPDGGRLPRNSLESGVLNHSPSDIITAQIPDGHTRVNESTREVAEIWLKDAPLQLYVKVGHHSRDQLTTVGLAAAPEVDHAMCQKMSSTNADTATTSILGKDSFPPQVDPVSNGDAKESDRHYIVLGRSGVRMRLGNIIFRTMCNEFRDTYTTTPYCLKQLVVERLIRQIGELDPPGKFVEIDGNSGAYVEIPASRIKSKVAQALREKRALSRKRVVKPKVGDEKFGRPPDDTKRTPALVQNQFYRHEN